MNQFIYVELILLISTGKYMLIEASSPRKPGEIARLVIIVPNNGNQSCLSFFYHMYGASAGTLNVYSGNTKVLSTSGNKGDNWLLIEESLYLDGEVSKILPFTNTCTLKPLSSDPVLSALINSSRQNCCTVCL